MQLRPWALTLTLCLHMFREQNFIEKLEVWAWRPVVFTFHYDSVQALQTQVQVPIYVESLTVFGSFTFFLCLKDISNGLYPIKQTLSVSELTPWALLGSGG